MFLRFASILNMKLWFRNKRLAVQTGNFSFSSLFTQWNTIVEKAWIFSRISAVHSPALLFRWFCIPFRKYSNYKKLRYTIKESRWRRWKEICTRFSHMFLILFSTYGLIANREWQKYELRLCLNQFLKYFFIHVQFFEFLIDIVIQRFFI